MKSLIVHSKKCIGCRNCIYACSFEHEDFYDPELSRIQVFYNEIERLFIPNFCLQCGRTAACILACPSGALFFDEKLNAVLWREQDCIHCHNCVQACPYKAITTDKVTDAILKCDLCLGNPICVQVCPESALEFIEMNEEDEAERSAHALTVRNFLKSY